MLGMGTHKPFEAVQAKTVPGRATSIFSTGSGYQTSLAGVTLRRLVSLRDDQKVKTARLGAGCAYPKGEGLALSQTLGFDSQSTHAAQTTMSQTQQKAESNYQQAEKRMNRAAILPILSLTIEVFHPFATDRYED